jgi:diguanylate cyclase (GGDEF)-like protein
METVTQGKQRYNQAMAQLREGQAAFSIVVLTLEGMEEINADLGHVKGQTILKNFSAAVKPHLREGDSCSRHGLNQLMIVLHDAGEDDTRRFCFNLAQKLKVEHILNGLGETIDNLNVSAGFAEAPMDATIDEVLASAESREATFLEFSIK